VNVSNTEHISLTNFVRVYRINCIENKRVEALEGACFLMTNPVTHGNPSWTAHCRGNRKGNDLLDKAASSDPVPCTAFGYLGIYSNQSSLLSLGCWLCFLCWNRVNPLITLECLCLVMTDVSFYKRKHQQPRKWTNHSIGSFISWRPSKCPPVCYVITIDVIFSLVGENIFLFDGITRRISAEYRPISRWLDHPLTPCSAPW
jgi:hypothetical protein